MSLFARSFLLIALLVWLGFKLAHRPFERFWARVLWIHLGLLVLHTAVVVPVGLGALVSSMTGTRDDERSYRGPRIAADGTWLMQTRETLSTEEATRTGMPARPYTDERTGQVMVPVAGVPGAGITDKEELTKLDAAAERLQMSMKSADGVPLGSWRSSNPTATRCSPERNRVPRNRKM